MKIVVALLFPFVCAGCPQAQCEKKINMLENDKWTQVAPADDPFAPPAPLVEPDEEGRYPPDDPGSGTPHNARVCTDASVYSEALGEDLSLTVDTNVCGWVTMEEPLSIDVAKDAPMFARIFYFQQIAPGISEAHLEATVDGKPFYTKTIPLPTPSDLIAEDFAAPFDAHKGQRLLWHIDNHGVNTWNLLELSVKEPADCPKAK